MKQFSVASMGVYPYITASIIIILLVPVIPKLQEMSQEGESGKNKINMLTHWLTVPLAGLSGYGQLVILQRSGAVDASSPMLTVTIVFSLIAGTMFLVWLGELITEYGIGNGISIIIFGGIVAGYPVNIQQGFLSTSNPVGLVVYIAIVLITIVLIVIFTEAHRRVPVQYARSVFRGGKMYRQAGTTHIPLRVNASGMIPLIFSMSIMLFPGIVASYFDTGGGAAHSIVQWFSPSTDLPIGLFYWVMYFVLSVAFTFFYTIITYQQQDLPGTLQRQGGFIPGIRPGKNTDQYLNGVINRITWAGALFLAFVAVMPFLARTVTNVQQIQLSSLGLLIVVGVVLDTMKQLEAQLVMRRYEGFIK
jgi:preprotein translocase subunit SecY